jgi:hypothetical protein
MPVSCLVSCPKPLQNKPKSALHDTNDTNDTIFDPARASALHQPGRQSLRSEIGNPKSKIRDLPLVSPSVSPLVSPPKPLQNKPKTRPGDTGDTSDGIFDPRPFRPASPHQNISGPRPPRDPPLLPSRHVRPARPPEGVRRLA